VVLTACGGGAPGGPAAQEGGGAEAGGVRSEIARFALLATDGEPLIDPSEMVDAASYDGIPSIDDPFVIPRTRADELLVDSEQVMLVEHEGQARAYPSAP
jgi:hypothetical protein